MRFFVVVLILFTESVWAGEPEWSGFVATGVKANPDGESFSEARLRLKTDRKDGARAVAAIEARSDAEDPQLIDAYIDLKVADSRFYLGQAKKRFGLEYDWGRNKRPAARRSLIYQQLEEFAYVGREMSLRYESRAASWPIELAIGYNETHDGHLLAHVSEKVSDLSVIGGFLLLQVDQIYEGQQKVWAVDFYYHKREGKNLFAVEWIGGVDPHASEFQKLYGNGKKVHFAGLKLEQAFALLDARLQPFYQASYLLSDLDEVDDNTFSFVVGANFYLTKKVRLAVNGRIEGSRTKEDAERDYYHNGGVVEALYRF